MEGSFALNYNFDASHLTIPSAFGIHKALHEEGEGSPVALVEIVQHAQ